MPASGVPGIHAIPLGSHLCVFYRSHKEFLRVTASFLSAGLSYMARSHCVVCNHVLCSPSYRRFPVLSPVTYEHGWRDGEDIVWNLSPMGWRISGHLPLERGDVCSLQLTPPD